MLGMATRAYPQISELLNSGRCKLTKKQRLRNRRIRDTAPRAPSEEEANRIQREIGVWKAFPTHADLKELNKTGTHLKCGTKTVERKKRHKLLTICGANKWTRSKSAMRDTYGDMEDKVNTNAGMRLESSQHDIANGT